MSAERRFSNEGAPTDERATEETPRQTAAGPLWRCAESTLPRPLSDATPSALSGEQAVRPPTGLAPSNAILRAILETLPMAVAIVAVPSFGTLLANRRFRESLGKRSRSADVADSQLTDVVLGQFVPDVASLLRQAAATGEPITVEARLCQHPEAHTTYWRLQLSPLRDDAGDLVALVVAAEDTTPQARSRLEADELAERLRATNEQLTLANLRLQGIIGRLPQGVIVLDREGQIALANSAAERLLGTTLPVGVKLYSLPVTRLKPDGQPYRLDELPLTRSLLGETCYGVEIGVKQPDARIVHTLCSSAPLYDAKGRIVAAVSIFQDITELRELDRLKDEFLSIASHELKNPLTVLKGYVQILLRSGQRSANSREARILAVIDQEVNRLSRLNNLMLDVSRIQLGGLRLDRRAMDLVALTRKLVASFQGVSRRHRFSFQTEVETLEGNWDQTRIEQVVANLVDNAVKYSPGGGDIAVGIRVVAGQVEVAVRDQGVGIPRDEQDRVFGKFYRSQARATAHAAGLGLGLYVCQEIIRAHGGQMWLQSEPGQGSTFHFSLPLR